MNAQNAFSLAAVFYSVANLGAMGLELNLRETMKSLRSVRVLGLTLGWSWLVGPAFAVLLTKILPMAEPYATGLLIFSLAPIVGGILGYELSSDASARAAEQARSRGVQLRPSAGPTRGGASVGLSGTF